MKIEAWIQQEGSEHLLHGTAMMHRDYWVVRRLAKRSHCKSINCNFEHTYEISWGHLPKKIKVCGAMLEIQESLEEPSELNASTPYMIPQKWFLWSVIFDDVWRMTFLARYRQERMRCYLSASTAVAKLWILEAWCRKISSWKTQRRAKLAQVQHFTTDQVSIVINWVLQTTQSTLGRTIFQIKFTYYYSLRFYWLSLFRALHHNLFNRATFPRHQGSLPASGQYFRVYEAAARLSVQVLGFSRTTNDNGRELVNAFHAGTGPSECTAEFFPSFKWQLNH